MHGYDSCHSSIHVANSWNPTTHGKLPSIHIQTYNENRMKLLQFWETVRPAQRACFALWLSSGLAVCRLFNSLLPPYLYL